MSNVTEFFRPEHLRPLDPDGFEIDSATREIAEIDAWFADQAARHNPLPPISGGGPDEPFEPSEADTTWLAEHPSLPPITGGAPEPFEPCAADWEDYARWSEFQDRLEGIYGLNRITDEDIEAAGLAVG